MNVNLRFRDLESFRWGKGFEGTGTSRKSRSGCHPSETSKTSSRFRVAVCSYRLDVGLEHVSGVFLVEEAPVENAGPHQLVDGRANVA